MAALRTGADLVQIYTPQEALIPIKSYSPELIVHEDLPGKDIVANSVVCGPGLGRAESSFNRLNNLVKNLNENTKTRKVLVLDADALWFCKDNSNA